MKRHIFLYVTLLLMVCFCLTLIGCAGGNSGTSAAEPTQQGSQHGSSTSEQAHTTQPEKTESAQEPNRPDETGRYRHEIDGIVFYTEHDLEQWIGHKDGLGLTFDLQQMAKDLFVGKQVFGGDTIQEDWIKSFNGDTFVAYRDPYNIDNNGYIIQYSLNNADLQEGHTSLQAKPGVYPYLAIGSTYVYDLGNGTGNEEYYKPYYFLNDSYHCTDYEMLEITLYACEQWVNGEHYDFENFNVSNRIWVYRH